MHSCTGRVQASLYRGVCAVPFFAGPPPGRHPANRSGRPPGRARKGRTDGRLRHENGYQVALALRGELGAGCAVTRLGVEFAEIAVSAQQIRSFPYPSKGNSAPLKVARISRRYEQRTRLYIVASDPAVQESDLFGNRDFLPLTLFDGLDEAGGLQKTVACSRIEPCESAPKSSTWRSPRSR